MTASASVTVETLFAPFDDTTTAFLDFIASAKTSLCIVIYGYHLPKLTDLLIAKHQAGLRVSVVLDHSQAEGKAEHTEVEKLKAAGVPFLIGASPVHRQILHSKFTVVDGARVEHGSWNYSLSAAQQSNTMTFVDDPDYAEAFTRHHDRLVAFIALHEMVYQEGQALAQASEASEQTSEPTPLAHIAVVTPPTGVGGITVTPDRIVQGHAVLHAVRRVPAPTSDDDVETEVEEEEAGATDETSRAHPSSSRATTTAHTRPRHP